MKTFKPKNPNWYWLLLGDLLVFAVAILVSWFIRARLGAVMSELLYEFTNLVKIMPLIVSVRILSNVVFDMYSVRLGRLRVNDISRIFVIYIAPTAVFILLRIYSTNYFLLLPFTVILIEYALSVFCSVLIRLIYINIQYRLVRKKSAHYRELLVYGDINELEPLDLSGKMQRGLINVNAIISPNPLQWEDHYQSIPIVGDIDYIHRVLKYNNQVSGVLIANPANVTNKRLERLIEICENLNLDLIGYGVDDLKYIRNFIRNVFKP